MCKAVKCCLAVIVTLSISGTALAGERQELLDAVGIKPESGLRGQMDTVGFVTSGAQMDSVLVQARSLAAPRRA